MKHFKKLSIIVIFIISGIAFCGAEEVNPVRNKTQTASTISNEANPVRNKTQTASAISNGVFFRANRQYDDGNFQEAAGLYEQLLSQGIQGGNIYYNLGNAYYKMGKKGKALINYERAKKLIPNNEDLFANISFIKSIMDVKQPGETYLMHQKIWLSLRDIVSVRVWFFISAALFFTLCLLLGAGFLNYRFRGRSHMLSGILLFLFVISLVLFIDSYNANKHFKPGIIIIPETYVRYSPSYSGVVAFKLVEGMRAQIIRKQGQWSHIRLNKQKSGWIESEAIEAIK